MAFPTPTGFGLSKGTLICSLVQEIHIELLLGARHEKKTEGSWYRGAYVQEEEGANEWLSQ